MHGLSLRVERRRGVLDLLDEPGHVLEEEVVHALLVHVPQLDHWGAGLVGHGGCHLDNLLVVDAVVAPKNNKRAAQPTCDLS